MNLGLASVTRAASRSLLKAKINSPRLMFAVGIVGVVGGTVLACRATLKVEDTLIEAKEKLDDINSVEHSSYSSNDRVQDRVMVYTQTTFKLGQLYAPAIIVGGLGLSCLVGSHNILTKRNAALTAAYAGLERSYRAYRERVASEIGGDNERRLHYEVERSVVMQDLHETKTGKVKKHIGDYSVYARFFDESSRNWEPTPEHNMIFLNVQQTYANDMLHARGHLFLNEVYDMIGVDRSKAGAVVGWVLGNGDNYVDFGIFNGRTREARNFVNNAERNVLLDFNVDGNILDLIDKDRR